MLCVEVNPALSSWYPSAFCTSSGYFTENPTPAHETFYLHLEKERIQDFYCYMHNEQLLAIMSQLQPKCKKAIV